MFATGKEIHMAHPDGITRRDFFASACAASFLPAAWSDDRDASPLRRSPAAPANCIWIFNSGGMSHIDLWDPKPDAPAGIRGDFRPIATSVPGLYFSELLPQTARLAHKLTTVRSVTHAETDHARARRLVSEVGNCKSKIEGGRESSRFLECRAAEDLESNCQTACRNLAAGCRFVGIENGYWDTHSRNSWTLKEILAPAFDRAFSGLITNLDSRGLLSSTRVVVATEFGRSPWINARGGRDHWPGAFSILLAGGGVAGGQVLGRTDRSGAYVTEGPVSLKSSAEAA